MVYPALSSLDPATLESALDLARALASASVEIARLYGVGAGLGATIGPGVGAPIAVGAGPPPGSGSGRTDDVAVALRSWIGPHRQTFERLHHNETVSAAAARRALEHEADAWARFWADATNARLDRHYEEAVETHRRELADHRAELERHEAGFAIDPAVAPAHPGPRPRAPVRPDRVPAPSAVAGYRATG